MNNPWKTLAQRVVYKNNWITVREDQVERPDGKPGIYGVVLLRPSVAVVAVNQNKDVALVGQWRYPVERFSWEIPRGAVDDSEHTIQAAAERELREEAGLAAQDWRGFGFLDLCNGVLRSQEHLFLATGLHPVEAERCGDERIVLRWSPYRDALAMIENGEITDATTVAALYRIAQHL
ncbi:MAG: NUDIX hydrolase [Bryobacteraceae bacterium]|nr:NUDIX hydrolase [Bryobacteraceae bacterium]